MGLLVSKWNHETVLSKRSREYIVPDNQICKIIQHMDSVEMVLSKYNILNI